MTIYQSIYDGPPHSYTDRRTRKRYIAIHNTSNSNLASAKDEAHYAKRRTDRISSHFYADRLQVVQSLDTALCAWHAGSREGNTSAIAYEITGWNSFSRQRWLRDVAWHVLAAQIAQDCQEYDIAPRALTVAELDAGQLTGIITHDHMRRVWGGTTHTDPGSSFPMDHLTALVHAHLGGNPPARPDLPGDDDMSSEGKKILDMLFEGTSPTGTQSFGGGIPRIFIYRQFHDLRTRLTGLQGAITHLAEAVATQSGTSAEALKAAVQEAIDERLTVIDNAMRDSDDGPGSDDST
jgi:N-acetyl-anhydromuramyl-L-alanine amidase AmpD